MQAGQRLPARRVQYLGRSLRSAAVDAHSWVEAFFEDVGWLEYDPTPPDSRARPFLLVRLGGQWLDALDSFWTDVISFDRMGQMVLFRSAGTRLFKAFEWSRGIRDSYREGRHTYRHWVRNARCPTSSVPRLMLRLR